MHMDAHSVWSHDKDACSSNTVFLDTFTYYMQEEVC